MNMNHRAIQHTIGIVPRESIPWELFGGPAYEGSALPTGTDSEIIVELCFVAFASFGAGSCSSLPFTDVPGARAFLGAAKKTSLVDGDGYLTIYRAAIVWNSAPGFMLQTTTLLTDAWLDADELSAVDE